MFNKNGLERKMHQMLLVSEILTFKPMLTKMKGKKSAFCGRIVHLKLENKKLRK